MPTGTIKRLVRDRGFGFIRDDGGQEWFFHRSSVEGNFDQLNEGQRVSFEEEPSAKGPRAGNDEEAARVKLAYFALWRYFPCGAVGEAAPDRNGLLPKALARVAACGGPAVPASASVVIGDTPLDVACAAASGARSIAVATG